MPKLKTNRGAAKRFRQTASGRYKRKHGFKNHILTKKTAKCKRQLRPKTLVHPSDQNAIQRLMTGS